MAVQSEPLAFPSRGRNREASRRFPGKVNGHRGGSIGPKLAPPLGIDSEGLLASAADLEQPRCFDPTPPATNTVTTYNLGELFADQPPDPFHGCHELIKTNYGLMAA